MIRSDLILPNDWERKFRKNNPKVDPEHYYRVGYINNELVVLNTDTGQLMDYFYDDVDSEWISARGALVKLSKYRDTRVKLKEILGKDSENQDRWFINKYTGYLKTITKTGKEIIMKGGKKTYGYPNFTISRIINLPCHILVAMMFVPNPKPNKFNLVNHIRDDKNIVDNSNFKKEVLQWCDYSYNNKYDRVSYKTKNIMYLYNNTWWSETDLIKFSGLSKKELRGIINSGKTLFNQALSGYTELARDYIEHNREKNPIWWDIFFNSTWKYCPNTKNMMVNACGVFRKGNMYSVGNLHNSQHKERRLFKQNHPVSRLVFSAFNNMLSNYPTLTLDHINNDVFDNRLINLQVLSREDNVRKMLYNRD